MTFISSTINSSTFLFKISKSANSILNLWTSSGFKLKLDQVLIVEKRLWNVVFQVTWIFWTAIASILQLSADMRQTREQIADHVNCKNQPLNRRPHNKQTNSNIVCKNYLPSLAFFTVPSTGTPCLEEFDPSAADIFVYCSLRNINVNVSIYCQLTT